MAFISTAPPCPLLLDYLLTSSWTWFAICLATIASALRVFLLRHRLVAQPPSPIAISSPEIATPLLSYSPTDQPSPLSASPHRSFRRRPRSKSTSALETLHKSGEDFLRSGMEFLSSVLDADLMPSLKKITSASKLFHDCLSCEKTHENQGLCAFSPAIDSRRTKVHDLAKSGLGADDYLGLGSGFISGAAVKENEDLHSNSFKDEQFHLHEDVPFWLPSWAYSLCNPLQTTLSFPSGSSHGKIDVCNCNCNDTAPIEALPCFEQQFGWNRLLERRLGWPWNSLAVCSEFAEKSSNVVKTWAGQQKKFVKGLDADALALDLCAQKGLVCTGNKEGEISLWELGRKAYAKASVSFLQPVVALSMNCEQGATMVGTGKGLGLWDQRSPMSMPVRYNSEMSTGNVFISALKSKGNGLCVANSDSSISMYDLRRLQGEPLHHSHGTMRAPVSSESDDGADFDLLEMLTRDVEEDFWEEGDATSFGSEVEAQKGGSMLSQFASFIRVLSTSV